ncbi:MAG: hypothetical protein ACFHU9_05460 [Fluviicola sp.]
MELLKVVSYFSSFSITLPLLVGFWLFRKLSFTGKIILIFIIITAIIETIAAVLFYQKQFNLFVFHIHTYFEFGFYSLLLIRAFKSTYLKQVVLIGIPVFLTLSIYLLFMVQGLDHFNSLQRHFEGALLILYFVIYLFHPKEAGGESWKKNHITVLIISSLLYFTGSLIVFIFADQMFSTGQDSAWIVHGILNTLLNVVFARTLLKCSKIFS